MTPHIEAKKEEIAQTVIMPGDPMRAKFIAENYLTDYKLVNDVRGMYAYTGYYNNKRVTVMGSGMGMPSMGIYSHELYKYYDVEKIIRIGSCGGYIPELKLFDIILSDKVYSNTNFDITYNNENCELVDASEELNNHIEQIALDNNIKIVRGNTACTEVPDFHMIEKEKFFDSLPKDLNIIAAEMEAFALFYVAKTLNKKAACLMTVVDSQYINEVVTPEQREKSLQKMMELALKSIE